MQLTSTLTVLALALSGTVLSAPVSTTDLHTFNARSVSVVFKSNLKTAKRNKAIPVVQNVLNAAHDDGFLIPAGTTVTIQDYFHNSPEGGDPHEHCTFKFENEALCPGGGKCTGHAWKNAVNNVPGTIFSGGKQVWPRQ